MRPRRINGSLPFGPLSRSDDDAWQVGEIRTSECLAEAIDKWYGSARIALCSLIGYSCQRFRPRFRWEPAAGPLARQHAGASVVSVAWREVSIRAGEIASTLGRIRKDVRAIDVITRHCQNIYTVIKRVDAAPGEEALARSRCYTAFVDATAARRTTTIRS